MRGGRGTRGTRRMRKTRRAADAGDHGTGKNSAAYELDVDACGQASDISSRNSPSFIDSFRRGFSAGRAGRRRGSRRLAVDGWRATRGGDSELSRSNGVGSIKTKFNR